jgi:phage-related protein
VAGPVKIRRATISWEGDSLSVLREWPKPIREDVGVALDEMQEGRHATLPVRPMPSIAGGVFELKDSDKSKWYRVIYMARREDVIYVLHCFTKDSAKTEKNDLATAKARWKEVQRRLREGRKDEKKKQSR